AFRHGRRHHADRSRLRGRGRREHHPEAAAKLQLRGGAGPARHRLHRRDRQDLAQVRQPEHHAGRVGRGRAAGAAQADRGHHGQRPAPGRAQAPEPGFPADRHDQHPVHLRWRLRRPGEGHRAADRRFGHRFRRCGQEQGPAQPDGRVPRGRAGGPDQVRPDSGAGGPHAGRRHAVGAVRRCADPDPDRAQERHGQAVRQAAGDGRRGPGNPPQRAASHRQEGAGAQDRRAWVAVDPGTVPDRHDVRAAQHLQRRQGGGRRIDDRREQAAAAGVPRGGQEGL
ncbi:MAG: ATP-dependent Clp protease ATP-binding subunit ClpX, partial [uncultured Ramlibacter sp.]